MPHYLIFGGGPEFCRAAGQEEEGGRTADVRCKVVQRIFEWSNYLYRVCIVNRDLALFADHPALAPELVMFEILSGDPSFLRLLWPPSLICHCFAVLSHSSDLLSSALHPPSWRKATLQPNLMILRKQMW